MGHTSIIAVAALIVLLLMNPTLWAESPAKSEPGSKNSEAATPHPQSPEIIEFRKTAIVESFPSGDVTLHGWLYKPAGKGPFPAIIWNHGSEKDPKAHPELGKFYTAHGYAVFLPVRQGHGNSPGKYIGDVADEYEKQVKDPALVRKKLVELHSVYNKDVVAALDWLKKQPFVDPKRIAVTGCSYGGIQTLLTSEKELGVRAYVPFAPGAMSWASPELRKRLSDAAKNARAPLFLIQAENDYSTGPSEVIGPIIRAKGGINRAKVYPKFGSSAQDGHGGFACWEEGISIWGNDVLKFLDLAGMNKPSH